jgi:predicted Zn-dependent protease with MMP-like domain
MNDENSISIDEVQDMLDELAEELPPEFYEELNGGIILLPEAHESEYSLRGDLYTLGTYHCGGGMGSYITIYYGSFMRLFPHLSREQLKVELRNTLRHEFRHHIETLAGEDDLVDEDSENLRRYLASHGRRLRGWRLRD